jgi:signal transduction histidine kinase
MPPSRSPRSLEALHLLSDYISAFLVNISLFREGKINQDQLERTKELQKHNIEAQHLLHDMKNSLQTALAIAKDIREKNTTTGVQRIEQSLWDLEDVLNTREDKLILTTIHITEFFHNILENYKDLFKEKHLHFSHTFTHDPSCIMRADRQKLKRILGNLLHNAYKFTPPHGTIILHTKQNAHFLSIELQNTGMGIANKNKLTIFDDGNTTHSDGKGHGLAIVRKYIEMHGGAISESRLEGKYASFHIQLPLQVESGIVIFPV